jgi:hypothetical protein
VERPSRWEQTAERASEASFLRTVPADHQTLRIGLKDMASNVSKSEMAKIDKLVIHYEESRE